MHERLTVGGLALVLVAAALASAVPGAMAGHQDTAPSDDHIAHDTTVTGAHGDQIAITVFRPAGASSADQVPVVLHGHGWGGDRDTDVSAFDEYLDAGYGVVSIDQRGHGDSEGQAHVMHPDHEVKDIQAILDMLAGLDWVITDGADDPRVGAIGGSYGGGYQLMTATQDDRLDALVPAITWYDLPYALAPNDAVKTTWVDLLYAAGVAGVDMAPFIHQGYAWGAATNEFPDGELPGEPDVKQRFTESSPAHHPGTIDVPTLLIQGMPDVLFNLNQALWNYHAIAQTGAEVKLVTHLSGHIVNTDGTIPTDGGFQAGLQPADAGDPCGDEDTLALAWFGEHLKDGPDDGLPQVSMALDDGTCATGSLVDALTLAPPEAGQAFPLAGPVAITNPSPATSGYVEAGNEHVPSTQSPQLQRQARSPIQLEVLTADQPHLVTGVPYLEGQLTMAGAEAIVYLSVVVEDAGGDQRVVDSQVTPLRVSNLPSLSPLPQPPLDPTDTEVAHPIAMELGGIGTELQTGETLYLEISTNDLQYHGNQERLPAGVVLEDLQLRLPIGSAS